MQGAGAVGLLRFCFWVLPNIGKVGSVTAMHLD